MAKPKHRLYVIAGPARVGKSTIAHNVMRQKHLITISTDVIRGGIKDLLMGNLEGYPRTMSFKSNISFTKPGSQKIHQAKFKREDLSEDDIAWIAVESIIKKYDRANNVDLLIEGIAITPERIHRLKLKNLIIKAAFIGYSNESHGASILKYSKEKKDWVYKWIKEQGGDASDVHKWVKDGIIASAKIEKAAKNFNYGYFDITQRSFKNHVQAVTKYLYS